MSALRDARSWHPVPLFYAVVAGVALVPAIPLALFTPARWWLALLGIPTAAVLGAFGWSLASGAGRWRRDIVRRLAPQRAWRQETDEELAAMREQIQRFRLLVPDGWPGVLSLGGASWTVPARGRRALHEMTVVADQGDAPPGPDRRASDGPQLPRVEIRVTRDPWGFPEQMALTELVDRTSRSAWPDLTDVDRTDRREVERRLRETHHERERQRGERESGLAHHWRDGNVVSTASKCLPGY